MKVPLFHNVEVYVPVFIRLSCILVSCILVSCARILRVPVMSGLLPCDPVACAKLCARCACVCVFFASINTFDKNVVLFVILNCNFRSNSNLLFFRVDCWCDRANVGPLLAAMRSIPEIH